MDYRTAIQFLAEHFPNIPLKHLMAVADDLVKATSPTTLASICEDVFTEYHRDHKIVFIKDVREIAKTHDIGYGLKECKDAVEAYLLAHPARETPKLDQLMSEPALWVQEDYHSEDESDRAFAEMLERRAESGTWFGSPTLLDEETPF